MTESDFQYIVSVSDDWWGGPSSDRTHPIFFHELGEMALVAQSDGGLIGFLLGFVTPTKVGYIHLVGIHPDFRRQGVARSLYGSFMTACQDRGIQHFKSITTPGNIGSVDFHKALGFSAELIANYAGPQRDRIVFVRDME